MVTKAVKQAVIPGSQYDWQGFMQRLPRVLLLLLITGLLVSFLLKLNEPGFLPVEKVRAQGEFLNVTEKMLIDKASSINGGYFNIDVRQIQKNVESLPWVDRAYVRRTWPDTLLITISEQQAFAVWHGKGLVNERGALFYPDVKSFPAGLPLLSGPDGTHKQLIEHYKGMQEMLLKSSLEIKTMKMDARRAITIGLTGGLKILLGREFHYKRLDRFIRIYDKLLVGKKQILQQVDMRYTNGFTILRKQ